MHCPSCGFDNPAGTKFCIECGFECGFPLKTRCTRCGVENVPRAKFCSECATPLQPSSESSSLPPPPPRPPSPHRYPPRDPAEPMPSSKSAVEGEHRQVTGGSGGRSPWQSPPRDYLEAARVMQMAQQDPTVRREVWGDDEREVWFDDEVEAPPYLRAIRRRGVPIRVGAVTLLAVGLCTFAIGWFVAHWTPLPTALERAAFLATIPFSRDPDRGNERWTIGTEWPRPNPHPHEGPTSTDITPTEEVGAFGKRELSPVETPLTPPTVVPARVPPVSGATSDLPERRGEIMLLHASNQARQDAGLPPLRGEAALHRIARRRSELLVARQEMGQRATALPDLATQLQEEGIDQVMEVVETFFVGQEVAHLSQAILRQWLQRPSDRAMLRDARFTATGVGMAWGRRNTVYVIQVYVARSMVPIAGEQPAASRLGSGG
jgi:uncharacterized protein YkwD